MGAKACQDMAQIAGGSGANEPRTVDQVEGEKMYNAIVISGLKDSAVGF